MVVFNQKVYGPLLLHTCFILAWAGVCVQDSTSLGGPWCERGNMYMYMYHWLDHNKLYGALAWRHIICGCAVADILHFNDKLYDFLSFENSLVEVTNFLRNLCFWFFDPLSEISIFSVFVTSWLALEGAKQKIEITDSLEIPLGCQSYVQNFSSLKITASTPK